MNYKPHQCICGCFKTVVDCMNDSVLSRIARMAGEQWGITSDADHYARMEARRLAVTAAAKITGNAVSVAKFFGLTEGIVEAAVAEMENELKSAPEERPAKVFLALLSFFTPDAA